MSAERTSPSSFAMIVASVVFPRSWRAVKKHVIQRFTAQPGRLDRDREILLQLRLSREIRKALGTQSGLKLPLVFACGGRNDPLFSHWQASV